RSSAIGGVGLSLTRPGSRPRPSSRGPTQPLGPGRAGSAWRERSGFGTNRDGSGPATSGTWRACGRAEGPPRAGQGPARGLGLGPGPSRRCSRRGCTVSTASADASTLTSPTRSRSPPSSSTGGASSVFWPGAWDSSVAALTGVNPLLQPPGRTHAVCTHKAHGALPASLGLT
ncbi:hypothetical protein Nmel_010311, partial [Mimus melanotis]